jgi:arginase
LGGLSLREGVFLVEEVYNTGNLKSFDLVEVNPCLGDEKDVHDTVSAAKLIIQAAVGSNRSGNCK